MIIGSGLLARSFCDAYDDDDNVCIYAAGVSNSGCVDKKEFKRERARLVDTINGLPKEKLFLCILVRAVFMMKNCQTVLM